MNFLGLWSSSSSSSWRDQPAQTWCHSEPPSTKWHANPAREVGLKRSPGIIWRNRDLTMNVFWLLHGFLLSLLTRTVLILIQQKKTQVSFLDNRTQAYDRRKKVLNVEWWLHLWVFYRKFDSGFLTCEPDLDWVLYCFYIVWFLCDLIHSFTLQFDTGPKTFFFIYYFQMICTVTDAELLKAPPPPCWNAFSWKA